jgi:flagellar assembly factor FliW
MPGFERERGFTLIEDPARAPLVILESETTSGLAFYAVPAELIDPGYEPQLSPEDLHALQLEPAGTSQLQWLAILALPENGPLTANLLAPVAINRTRGLAVQAVRWDQRYSHQHPLGEALCS